MKMGIALQMQFIRRTNTISDQVNVNQNVSQTQAKQQQQEQGTVPVVPVLPVIPVVPTPMQEQTQTLPNLGQTQEPVRLMTALRGCFFFCRDMG